MSRLVDRFGRTGFAAVSSLIWALPMAAWAGSADLSPIDKTAYPWIALTIGLVMLVVWLVLLTRLQKIEVTTRPRRVDFAQMSGAEKRWGLATFVFACGLVAWLNAAATVDWTPLAATLAEGKSSALLFAAVLASLLIALLAGLIWTWRRYSAAFRSRIASFSKS
jgi:membrane protease YdiL (CAAX protease family)